MGYDQWIQLTVKNVSGVELKTTGIRLNYGKLYDCVNKDNEVGFNSTKIPPRGGTVTICSCGRESSPSGTEGTLSISEGDTLAANIYWDCPWSGDNRVEARSVNENWVVQVPPVSKSGAIGRVTVKLAKVA